MGPQSDTGYRTPVLCFKRPNSFLWFSDADALCGEIFGRYQVIHRAEQVIGGFVVELVNVDHDGYSGFARPACSLQCCGRVAPIKM